MRRKRYSYEEYDLIANPYELEQEDSFGFSSFGTLSKLYKKWKWKYYWIVENELAIAPMPDSDMDTQRELEKFPTIIALENPTYTPPNSSRVYVIPVRDFSTDKEPFTVALFILDIARKPVLVHCKGGCGRSGTLASLYLLYKGIAKTPEEAIRIVQNKRGCGPETEAQRHIVEEFYKLLR